jgi:hypothetical protein
VNGFGAALSGGWYNTAETHKLGGFDLTFTANVAFVPDNFGSFLIDTNQLTVLRPTVATNNIAPTISGVKETGPGLSFGYDEYSQPAFNMPKGLNAKKIPAPMIQAGVGLIKGTELMLRYMPNVKIKGNEFGLWGIGGKHDIKQWIPGLKKIPVLQLSLMYGYTRLHTNIGLNVSKASINASSLPGEEDYETNGWPEQDLKLLVQSQTANLLIGANLPVISFYGAVGFVTTKTSLKLEGEYPMVYMDGITPSVQALADPVDMEIKNQDGSITKPRLNAGMRLKLAVITIHADYTWSNYSVVTAGLGISIR